MKVRGVAWLTVLQSGVSLCPVVCQLQTLSCGEHIAALTDAFKTRPPKPFALSITTAMFRQAAVTMSRAITRRGVAKAAVLSAAHRRPHAVQVTIWRCLDGVESFVSITISVHGL